ncbi:hypothetical protein ACFUJY_29770 [Streptomyces sp. NPDC057249]|uniref:hypothetical protein n=1 Tax=Streptomyces sp. NPDC057249 TaxID=3346067 RepID=UPI0036320982
MRTALLPTIVKDPATLAAHLAKHGMPGQRSKTAIARLRRERERRTLPPRKPLPLPDRVLERQLAAVAQEIQRRGGETAIAGRTSLACLTISDRRDGLVLVHAEGWRHYSRRVPARYARLSYLWGPDDAGSGPWAVRVAGTITTVADALDWLTPADVKKAQDRGLHVRRQGDVYAIQTTARRDGEGAELLPESHEWRPSTRYLVHRPEDGRRHRPLRLPWPVRFVQQTAYGMGRTNSRSDAD